MKLFIQKIYVWLILLSEKQVTFWDKLSYMGKLIATFGPVVALLEAFQLWFASNQVFIGAMLIALVLNMIVGVWYHMAQNTFSWSDFFRGNIKMFAGVFLVYIMLELLRMAAGHGIVSEGFKIIVQVTTMLWPVSKSLKNLHIIYGKKWPPPYIMNRIYNFEKSGNVKELFDTEINNKAE